MHHEFHELVQAFCTLAGLEHPEDVAQGCSFCVDNIDCALIYLDHLSPDIVHCYIDFGVPPQEQCVDVYRQLLRANYLQLASGSAAFTVSPETGHVILISTLRLADANPEVLADLLAYHAQQALDWRRNFYLDQLASNHPDSPGDAGVRFA